MLTRIKSQKLPEVNSSPESGSTFFQLVDNGDESAFLHGYIFLDKLKEKLEQNKNFDLTEINFCGNGYCTDAVLKLILDTLPTKNFKELHSVNLTGCNLITDTGLGWLTQIIQHSKKLTSVTLDACTRVTECGLMGLLSLMQKSTFNLSAMATSTCCQLQAVDTRGCPAQLDSLNEKHVKMSWGNVYVVPHHSLSLCFSDFLNSKAVQPRPSSLHLVQNWTVKDFTLSITEVAPYSPFFDYLVGKNPVQVIIPFDASMELKDAKEYVVNTISRILSKETINPAHVSPKHRPSHNEQFMDPLVLTRTFLTSDGVLSNAAVSEKQVGCYVSRQPLSRSNAYFEVEVLTGGGMEKEAGMVIGIVHDVLFQARSPMDSSESNGGAVDGVTLASGDVIRFGIEGNWDSEYVPGDEAKYYILKNGEKMPSNALDKEKPHIGMYPLIALVSKNIYLSVRMLNYPCHSESLQREWELEKKTVEPGFTSNVLYDENGVVTYQDSYKTTGNVGIFISRSAISKNNCTCSLEILDTGAKGTITFGVGLESYKTGSQPGWIEPSVAFHGDDGAIFKNRDSKKPKYPTGPWKNGDIVTVTVSGFQGQRPDKGETITVTFQHNKKEVETLNLELPAELNEPVVFLVGMHSKGEKARILNYRNPFLTKSASPSKLTMGRSNFLNIYDDGRLSYRKFDSRDRFGTYVSKSPISKHLPYFELKVLALNERKHLGIGLCPMEYPDGEMIGWYQGSIAYHADNGAIYHSSGSTDTPPETKHVFEVGDIIGCGIDVDKAKFQANGTLVPQQDVPVYFCRNGKKTHSETFKYLSNGLFPCVSLHFEGDAVQLLNYDPCANHYLTSLGNRETSQAAKEEKKEEVVVEGCRFLVVGVANGKDDPQGRVTLLSQQLNLDHDLKAKIAIDSELKDLASHLDELDLQGQQNYAQLSWQLECLRRLARTPDRISFHSLHLPSGKGYEDLVEAVAKNQKREEEMHPKLYNALPSIKESSHKLLKSLSQHKAMKVTDMTTLGIAAFQYADTTLALSQYLHQQGQLVVFPTETSVLAMDRGFLTSLSDFLSKKPADTLHCKAVCAGADTPVWSKSDIVQCTGETWTSAAEGELQTPMPDLFSGVEEVLTALGMVCVPCLRTLLGDPISVYSTLDCLAPTPRSPVDYLKESSANLMAMKRRYDLPCSNAASVLPLALRAMTDFSRPIVLAPTGGVFQSGAITTVICHTQPNDLVAGDSFTIQSQCFLPDQDERTFTAETVKNVEEYTWNVFCLACDLMDFVLRQQGITPVLHIQNLPGLVNVSVGCMHDWSSAETRYPQSLCTLCGQCCEHGLLCPWAGIPGEYLNSCRCYTQFTGCKDCGICQNCASRLWSIRSALRPCGDTASKNKPGKQSVIPLLTTTYNEVECIGFSRAMAVCLKQYEGFTPVETSERMIQVFPGRPVILANKDELNTHRANHPPELQLAYGDRISIRLHDIKGAKAEKENEQTMKEIEIKPVYFTLFCREARVCHETGIVCYDSKTQKVPVAQFAGARPLSAECNKFSVEILNPGRSRTIAIGLVHKRYSSDRQPGWDSSSIGYHADDGGIFMASGWPGKKVASYQQGDVVTCELNLEEQVVIFYKNGEMVFKTPTRVRIPPGGFYPCVAMHSTGESVLLHEKDPWLPAKDGDVLSSPAAFPTYKYGNLWISPGQSVTVMSERNQGPSGWLLLHNPSKDLIGYQTHPKVKLKSAPNEFAMGSLEPGKTVCLELLFDSDFLSASKRPSIAVRWLLLETGRKYNQEELGGLFQVAPPETLNSHKLLVKGHSQEQVTQQELDPVDEKDSEHPKDSCILEVLKNGSSMGKYWLKRGSYYCAVEEFSTTTIAGIINTFLLRYPKFPTCDLPRCFQRGMRIIGKVSKDVYAECIITDVEGGGKYLTLEYSPKDGETNQPIRIPADSPDIHLKEVPMVAREKVEPPQKKTEEEDAAAKDGNQDQGDGNAPETKAKETKTEMTADIDILGYLPRGHTMYAKRAYVYPPPHLLTEASRATLEALDANYRLNSLSSMNRCSTTPTRITVQELQMTSQSQTLRQWAAGSGKDGALDQVFAFLPHKLDYTQVCYPSTPDIYTEVDVHRLCLLMDRPSGTDESLEMDVPIHFANVPAIKPSHPIPLELMYGSVGSGWTYTALVARKLQIPFHDKFISPGKLELTRRQLEFLMGWLLRMYASLCHIFAEQVGSLQHQVPYINGTSFIQDAIMQEDKSLQMSKSATMDASTLIKRLNGNSVVCKAHISCHDSSSWPNGGRELAADLIQPYQDNVLSVACDAPQLVTVSKNFFPALTHLQVFELKEFHSLKVLPEGLSQGHYLEIIILDTGSLAHLPEDIFSGPALKRLVCRNMPVSQLPSRWPKSSKLRHLELSGLLISSITPELAALTELEWLDLSNNPITDLPSQLKALTQLRTLCVNGMPWLTMDLNHMELTLDQFSTWFAEHPYMQNFLSKEKIQKMFMEFDHNRNGTLDAKEVAGLNVKLFKSVPRLGSNNGGMVPDVIFELPALEDLCLNFQGICAMPSKISQLKNLASLSLQYNLTLVSLPGKLGHLPNIKSIVLTSCPNLRTPPHEVLGRGFESVKAYLKRLAGGYTECRRTKLMLVGLGGAGKTSLLRALMSTNKRTEGTKGEDITDGIIIQPWTAKSKEGVEVTYSSWDFAGQTLYYNTHQFFLSKRAIYLLLWSTRQGFEHAGLDFWLSSIASHAPKTPIFVVGTRIDEVPKAEVPVSELKKRYPQIAGFHFVSCLEGTGIKELEEDMLSVTLAQKNMGEKIPQVWLSLEDKILKARNVTSTLRWSVIKEYGMEVGIYDEKDIKEAIQFLHELGTVQYFDNDFLRDQVVINPQWIVNVMSCVVSVKESCIQSKHGQFYHEDIPQVWGQYPSDLHKWLLQLTEEFDLTFPLPQSPINIVPCLLPQEEPSNLHWPAIDTKKGFRETKMVYHFAYLPAGLFNRAQVRLFQFSSGNLIWKRGSMLQKNAHMALIKQVSDNELEVRVQGPRPENIVFLVHEIFESLIEESFHGVQYDIFIPCPDCVSKEGTFDPAMFDRTLVVSAQNHRAPFLQCRKFFHTISMSQLLEIMPGNADEDFDAHLQRSIVMLKELNSAQAQDVVILYSPLDATPRQNSNTVQPAWVREDIEKAGFSCWFVEDMRNADMNEMIVVLKKCKVVVALLSDHFERDEKCRDTLLYAKNRLEKSYVIVSVGESLAWQNTDMGMQIGKQELMVMVSTKARYESRKEELVRYVQGHIKSADNVQSDLQAVFISYCWTNSHDAVRRGTKEKDGALGWEGGDPRKLKKELEDRGIKCWIDVEQAKAGKGLFENITSGMCTCQVLVVCLSDEYVNSPNCMMEMRFGVLNLNMPLIVALVGTGKEWKRSEAGILMHRAGASKVYFQQENEAGPDVLANFVKDSIPKGMEAKSKERMLKQQLQHRAKSKQETSNIAFSYQEEYELMQRKFMRHITSFISTQETIPMPRLIIFDFDQAVPVTKTSEAQEARPTTSRPGLRPKTASRVTRHRIQVGVDDDDSWEEEKIYAKVLCEYEQGWHVIDGSLLVRPPEDWLERLKHFAPFLARIYAVLKQSEMHLNCFMGSKGASFQKWIGNQSIEGEFLEAYKNFREFLTGMDDADNLFNLLDRCHLPSGKVYWLCPEHQKGPRITKLSKDVRTQKSQRRVVTEQDMLMKEIMELDQQTTTHSISTSSLFSKKKVATKTKPKEEPKPAEKAFKTTAPKDDVVKASTPQQALDQSAPAEVAAARTPANHGALPGERAMNKKRLQRSSAQSAASIESNASGKSTTSEASRKAKAAADAVRATNAAANKSKACVLC